MRPTLLLIVATLLVCMSSEVNTFTVKYANFVIYVSLFFITKSGLNKIV
jgi:hypothetical protein